MNDEGKWMKEERRKIYKTRGNLIIFFLSLMGLVILAACSSQQQRISSTICGEGFHVLAGLDNMMEFSPNEEWILVNCESATGESEYVRVFRVDGSASWEISIDAFSWNTDENAPLASLASFHWIEDGKSVYLRPICCYDLDNHGYVATNYGLYLLNLRTGKLSVVLSGENDDASPFSVSISPDEKYLVYVDLANAPNILNVSNLQTGEEKAITLDEQYKEVGVFVWTLDNSKLVFMAVLDEWRSSSLYLLDINNLTLSTIIENDERLLRPASKWDYQGKWGSWKDENTLFLGEMGGSQDWAVNIQTGAIVEDNSPDSRP